MVKPTAKIFASMLLVVLALAIVENLDLSTSIWTNDLGTPIAGIEQGSPWKGIGLKGAVRFWNGTLGTHEGGLQKWPMYWFVCIDVKIWVNDNETFYGGCLVIPNWEEAYGWTEIAVRDAKAHSMKIIVIESFEQLAIICYSVDRTLLIHSYLDPKKTWIQGGDTARQKQLALDYFNQRWQTNYTIDEILANSAAGPWT